MATNLATDMRRRFLFSCAAGYGHFHPLVIVPLIADQFFNAEVVQRLQLGQVIQRGQLTPATIRAAVEEVLNNQVYRQNVARLQTEMHALPDQQYAVSLVERVVAERKLLLNVDLPAMLPRLAACGIMSGRFWLDKEQGNEQGQGSFGVGNNNQSFDKLGRCSNADGGGSRWRANPDRHADAAAE